MAIEVPAAIAAYLVAKNARDVDGMLAQFGPEAVVGDEGETHRGTTAIRAWMEHTTRKYAVRVEVTGVETEGALVVVTADVAGNFPGSPVRLRYRFTLAGERIVGLAVG